MTVFLGLMIPFLGTTLGAACVFFLKKELGANVQKALLGFASGVMVAASVWSLLIPSMDMSASMGRLAFIPACGGLLIGMAFLLFMDRVIPHLHMGAEKAEGPSCSLKKSTMLVLAVTLHNIPEGMAVGVVLPACWQKMRILPRLRLLPSLLVLPFRTFRKEPSFPFR